MQMLTVKEAAELKGCSERYIQKLIADNKLASEICYDERNRKKYLIPITELDPALQQKYYKLNKLETILPTRQAVISKPLDHYSEHEREEIAFWIDTVEKWQDYRNHPKVSKKTDVDEYFVSALKLDYPDLNVSVDTLYRRWNSYKNNDIDGLIDKRGKWKKGKSTIDETLWQAFLSFYLDEAQHPIKKCYEYTKMWARQDFPELLADIPSYTTFYRRVQSNIPKAVEVLGREGEKAYRDRCAPYISREYDNMQSNEWWIADNHTFDVISQDKNGTRHRLYLTAFFDARSGIFTGCHVTDAPCSQATLIALRKGILKYGIPDNIYVDNGREFLTFDIGGLGHRKKKPKDGVERFEPPPVFQRLGIKMTNALVRNAKAKIIERRFRDVKDHLSRLFDTFTGGNVVERPERLKSVLKDGIIPLDGQLVDIVESLLDYYFNQQEYGGAVANDRGKVRMQVYNENLKRKRKASNEDLNLMLMRSSRPQKVTRRGVHLDIAGQRIDYWNEDMLMTLLDKQVYYRYDPDDLSEVRIYNLDDKYIMSVKADNEAVLEYGASKDKIKQAMSKVRRMERVTKEALKVSAIPAFGRRTALELVMAQAQECKTGKIVTPAEPKIIEIHRVNEQPLLQAAVGYADIGKMNENALKNKGGQNNGESI